jgi:hypothetical protein
MDFEGDNLKDSNKNLKNGKINNFIQLSKMHILYFIIIFFCLNFVQIFVLCLIFFKYDDITKKTNINELFIQNQNEMLKYRNNIVSYYNYNVYSNNIHDKLKILRLITNNNYIKYEGVEKCLLNDPDSLYCIYHLIAPKKVIGKERILIGEKENGCYVILNDFKNIRIAYSFGISKAIQFDKGLADRNIDVYMYDHTINKLPYNNPKFHWEKIGICGKNKTKSNNLKTLEELMLKNGHSSERNMILKIDIEGNEWESLKDVPENILKQFKYIIIEYHFTPYNVELYYNVIKKLYKNHQVFYLRCHGREQIVNFGINSMCKYLEASYVIREGNAFDKDESIYPIFEFDFHGPNPNAKNEINLNILKLFLK